MKEADLGGEPKSAIGERTTYFFFFSIFFTAFLTGFLDIDLPPVEFNFLG